jgi:hypothetical protein
MIRETSMHQYFEKVNLRIDKILHFKQPLPVKLLKKAVA